MHGSHWTRGPPTTRLSGIRKYRSCNITEDPERCLGTSIMLGKTRQTNNPWETDLKKKYYRKTLISKFEMDLGIKFVIRSCWQQGLTFSVQRPAIIFLFAYDALLRCYRKDGIRAADRMISVVGRCPTTDSGFCQRWARTWYFRRGPDLGDGRIWSRRLGSSLGTKQGRCIRQWGPLHIHSTCFLTANQRLNPVHKAATNINGTLRAHDRSGTLSDQLPPTINNGQ